MPRGTRRVLFLGTFTSDTTGKLNVFWHDRYTLSVDGTQVRIFKKTDQVRFGGFLECQHGRSLETQIGFEILGNLTNKTLEWQLADQEVG